jgi:hypothetical protein
VILLMPVTRLGFGYSHLAKMHTSYLVKGAFNIFDACFASHGHREGGLEGRYSHSDSCSVKSKFVVEEMVPSRVPELVIRSPHLIPKQQSPVIAS